MERRAFLAAALGGAMTLAGCTPSEKPSATLRPTATPESIRPREIYTSSELQMLGRELAIWRYDSGQRVSDTFPIVGQAGAILRGEVNPKMHLPFLSTPIQYQEVPIESGGAFNFVMMRDPSDGRRTKVKLPTGEIQELPWITHTTNQYFGLSSEVRNSSIRPVVITKEVAQLTNMPTYTNLFLSLAQGEGLAILDFTNPQNIPTTDLEMKSNLASNLSVIEHTRTKSSFYKALIDAGEGIRTGNILFANWNVEYANKRQAAPQYNWTNESMNQIGYLQKMGYIRQPKPGSLFEWTKGRAPEIGDSDFRKIMGEYYRTPFKTKLSA